MIRGNQSGNGDPILTLEDVSGACIGELADIHTMPTLIPRQHDHLASRELATISRSRVGKMVLMVEQMTVLMRVGDQNWIIK